MWSTLRQQMLQGQQTQAQTQVVRPDHHHWWIHRVMKDSLGSNPDLRKEHADRHDNLWIPVGWNPIDRHFPWHEGNTDP